MPLRWSSLFYILIISFHLEIFTLLLRSIIFLMAATAWQTFKIEPYGMIKIYFAQTVSELSFDCLLQIFKSVRIGYPGREGIKMAHYRKIIFFFRLYKFD